MFELRFMHTSIVNSNVNIIVGYMCTFMYTQGYVCCIIAFTHQIVMEPSIESKNQRIQAAYSGPGTLFVALGDLSQAV